MPTNLQLDADISAVEDVTGSAVGWAGKVEALLRKALGSATNPFGSAARRDVGIREGNLVELDAEGLLPATAVPAPVVDPAVLIPSAVAVATLANEARATFDTLDALDTYYDLVNGDVRAKTQGVYLVNAYIYSEPDNAAAFDEMQLLAGQPGAQRIIAEYDAQGFSRATMTAFWTAAANDRIGASITGVDANERATFTLGLVRLR